MSISGALSNALSGLTASARSADVAASNIANAMTEGYGPREVILSPRAAGDEGGVQVLGIVRHMDQVLVADRREAEASLAHDSVTQTFFSRMQVAMGLPSDPGSLAERLSQLESSLAEATRAPESEPHLQKIKEDLFSLTTHLNDLGDAVQTERERADLDIFKEVEKLNEALEQLEDLNSMIRRQSQSNHDISAMLDQRQELVDYVSSVIPVRELERGQGTIALMASGGTMLLDGKASQINFSNSAVITADMSLSGGTLSALEINGKVIDTSRSPSTINGGRLDALFQLRDSDATELQDQLDGFARDLIERFEDPAVDPTRLITDPGLLTDNGAVLDPLDETGLAQRISVNGLIDPEAGGAVWRIRDGLGATVPGPEGQSAGLLRLGDALTAFQSPSSSAFSGGERSSATLASDLTSHVGSGLNASEVGLAFSQAQYETLKAQELGEGVDTDAELQRLLLIEQTYSANARVVQVVDEMLDWLMRI